MSTPASRTPAAKSYRPAGYKMSPGLQRARMPFAVRNAITGGSILVFIAGVYYYSISAVKQDDFADVQDLLPPPSARPSIKTIEEELSEKKARGPVVYTPTPVGTPTPEPTTSASSLAHNSTSAFPSVTPSTNISTSPSAFMPGGGAGPSASGTMATSSNGGLEGGFMSGTERPISGLTTAIEREASAFASEAKEVGKSILNLNFTPGSSSSSSSSSTSTPASSSSASSKAPSTRSAIEEQMHLFRVPVFSGRTGSFLGLGSGTREVEIDKLGRMGLFDARSGKEIEERAGGRRLV